MVCHRCRQTPDLEAATAEVDRDAHRRSEVAGDEVEDRGPRAARHRRRVLVDLPAATRRRLAVVDHPVVLAAVRPSGRAGRPELRRGRRRRRGERRPARARGVL